jgi:hypothetical protein
MKKYLKSKLETISEIIKTFRFRKTWAIQLKLQQLYLRTNQIFGLLPMGVGKKGENTVLIFYSKYARTGDTKTCKLKLACKIEFCNFVSDTLPILEGGSRLHGKELYECYVIV